MTRMPVFHSVGKQLNDLPGLHHQLTNMIRKITLKLILNLEQKNYSNNLLS